MLQAAHRIDECVRGMQQLACRFIVTTNLLLAHGCTLFLPFRDETQREAAATAEACTLQLGEERRTLPLDPEASGTAYPFILRVPPNDSRERALKSPQSIYLQSSDPRSRNAPAGEHRFFELTRVAGSAVRIRAGAFKPLKDAQPWIIERLGTRWWIFSSNPVLRSGAIIRLRSPQPHLWIARGIDSENLTATRDPTQALEFRIYKADAPDPMVPTTCDEVVRGGDYVFIQTKHPKTWLSPNDDGVLHAGLPQSQPDTENLERLSEQLACPSNKRICHRNEAGYLICTWVADCGERFR